MNMSVKRSDELAVYTPGLPFWVRWPLYVVVFPFALVTAFVWFPWLRAHEEAP